MCERSKKGSAMTRRRRRRERMRATERESQVVADGLLPEINSFWGRVTMATQVMADRDWLCY